jgi:flagellar FliL protein
MATDKEPVDGAEGEEGAPKPKSKKGLIIGIVAVLLLGGGGAGAYFAFGHKADEKGGKQAKSKVEEEKEKLPPRYIALDPPFVVNFEAESAVRFLQVTAQIMTRDLETEKLVKDNDPRLRNDLLLILGGQTYASVSTTEGKEALRTRCLEATRAIVKDMGGEPKKIEALYFTSFVMQ